MRSNKDRIQIPNELFERIDFIGREKELENLRSKMDKSSTHIIVLSGFAGTGKSCLVNEYGHQIKGNEYIVRWINADTYDNYELSFRQLARLFLIPNVEELQLNELIDHIISRIQSIEKKFLFILDNVEEYELIKYLRVKSSDLSKSLVKLMITTRYKNIIKNINQEFILELDAFNLDEANIYLKKHLTIAEQLSETQKNKLIELVQFEQKILPKKLELTVLYINENLIQYDVDELLEEIKAKSISSKAVQTYI